MLNWTSEPMLLVAGFILAALQFCAALPWLWAIDSKSFERTTRSPGSVAGVVGGVALAGLAIAAFLGYKAEASNLQSIGQYVYGAALHLQLLIDFFLLMPALFIYFTPKFFQAIRLWKPVKWLIPASIGNGVSKMGAVAYAAYREGWRQPMFWLIIVGGIGLTWASVVIPYFTFGDDYKMMKQIGFDIIMLAAVLFGVLAASMSISEEIEGRTAVTLMSKPVNRRQFLIGKFAGIIMACIAMSLVLGWNLNYALRVMPEFDKINEVKDSMLIQSEKTFVPTFETGVPTTAGKTIARGTGLWFSDAFAHSIGIVLGFGQVMILVSIAAGLATRLPFVINLVLCLVVYFLGHLAPVVVKVTEKARASGDSTGLGLVGFLGQLFDVVLPALEFFNMGPAIIREAPLDMWSFGGYVLAVLGYAVLYTGIALLIGLLLFEDRDLA